MVGWLLMSHPLYTVKLFAKAKWEIRENELVHNECEETTDEYVCNPCKKQGVENKWITRCILQETFHLSSDKLEIGAFFVPPRMTR